VKFGIVAFLAPATTSTLPRAPPASATPSLSGTPTTTLWAVDAVIVPGRFSYGDYLRAGAIARFAPVMAQVEEFAREGGLVLGICNGFQVLQPDQVLAGSSSSRQHSSSFFPVNGSPICRRALGLVASPNSALASSRGAADAVATGQRPQAARPRCHTRRRAADQAVVRR
jgi:putative intracellular protease/amidase